jgi:hypothetical protein
MTVLGPFPRIGSIDIIAALKRVTRIKRVMQ